MVNLGDGNVGINYLSTSKFKEKVKVKRKEMFKCSWEKEGTRQDGGTGGQKTQRETPACCRTELSTPIFQHIATDRGRLE